MKRHLILILIGIWLGSVGLAPGSLQEYSQAVKYARAGQADFAFMYFNKLLRNYPKSKYRDQALFATGEYYFGNFGLKQAESAFQAFVDEYPDSNERLYALAYLLSVARKNNDEARVSGLEKQIIDLQQVSLIFRKTKETSFTSPLHQFHKAIIYIDKIEFFVEGELFAKVSY